MATTKMTIKMHDFAFEIPDAVMEHETLRNATSLKKGSIIRRYRMMKGWSQRDLADRVWRSTGWVSALENGRNSPSEMSISDVIYELDHTMAGFYTEVEESVMRRSACTNCNYEFGNPHACTDYDIRMAIHAKPKPKLSVVKNKKAKKKKSKEI